MNAREAPRAPALKGCWDMLERAGNQRPERACMVHAAAANHNYTSCLLSYASRLYSVFGAAFPHTQSQTATA